MRDDARTANLTGVVALGIATDVVAGIEAATGLTSVEVAALTTLANWADGRSIERLREVTALSQPGCARLVDRLVAAGLARRERDRVDRRVTTVWVTAAGRTAVGHARAARSEAVGRWLDGLEPDDRARWGDLVETLAGSHVDGAVTANRRCRLCDATSCGVGDACPVTRGAMQASS